jgi:hypothetical protein
VPDEVIEWAVFIAMHYGALLADFVAEVGAQWRGMLDRLF